MYIWKILFNGVIRSAVFTTLRVIQMRPMSSGGKDMTLKEEREYKLIEDQLIYKPDMKKWEAGYPWIKDP